LLLLSSLSFGLAVLALDMDRRWPTIFWLLATALLGLSFLVLEISDFRDLIARGLAPQENGFLSAVFVLIGTHGLHVAMGILWIVILAVQLMVQGDDPQTRSRLLRLSYYWHFLDIVWIGIYSVVILPGFIT
ncbi:MAG: cytochrome c oxidase subunit 3, partial [Aestuariivirga sp.]